METARRSGHALLHPELELECLEEDSDGALVAQSAGTTFRRPGPWSRGAGCWDTSSRRWRCARIAKAALVAAAAVLLFLGLAVHWQASGSRRVSTKSAWVSLVAPVNRAEFEQRLRDATAERPKPEVCRTLRMVTSESYGGTDVDITELRAFYTAASAEERKALDQLLLTVLAGRNVHNCYIFPVFQASSHIGCFVEYSGKNKRQKPQWCSSSSSCQCAAQYPYIGFVNGDLRLQRAEWSCFRSMPQTNASGCHAVGDWFVGGFPWKSSIYSNPYHKASNVTTTATWTLTSTSTRTSTTRTSTTRTSTSTTTSSSTRTSTTWTSTSTTRTSSTKTSTTKTSTTHTLTTSTSTTTTSTTKTQTTSTSTTSSTTTAPPPPCSAPVSLVPLLPDSAISASSQWTPQYDAALKSRITDHGWAAAAGDTDPWLQWDFGTLATIKTVQTLGRQWNQWTERYNLEYTQDNVHWAAYPGDFEGNQEWNIMHENVIDPPIRARKLRMHVVRAHNTPSARVELLGCLMEDEQKYIRYENTNAYDMAHGATPLGFPWAASAHLSASMCKQSCTDDPACECVVISTTAADSANSECWKRAACDITRLAWGAGAGFDVFVQSKVALRSKVPVAGALVPIVATVTEAPTGATIPEAPDETDVEIHPVVVHAADQYSGDAADLAFDDSLMTMWHTVQPSGTLVVALAKPFRLSRVEFTGAEPEYSSRWPGVLTVYGGQSALEYTRLWTSTLQWKGAFATAYNPNTVDALETYLLFKFVIENRYPEGNFPPGEGANGNKISVHKMQMFGRPQEACTDAPSGWVSSAGTDCSTYATGKLCTPSGGYGSGWKPTWGTFSQYAIHGIAADRACCACGGGQQGTVRSNV